MIALEVADLVVIASRTLGLDTGRVLDLLDVAAAEHALAQARPGSEPGDLATQAAALLDALVRQRPLRRGNQQVALVAMLQFWPLTAGRWIWTRLGRSQPWSPMLRQARSAPRISRAGWRLGCGPAAVPGPA